MPKQSTLLETWRNQAARNYSSRALMRNRGRGKGVRKSIAKLQTDETIEIEDDDSICAEAMGHYELDHSEIGKALKEASEAKEVPDFDKGTGIFWIYPTNRPVRDYQFSIVKTSLFNNTLVCLPTGLGKTYVGAVVMYNYNRWFPGCTIVFLAPTRPLVTQQMVACHKIVGINPNKTIELTGSVAPKKREVYWKTKEVFFLTPQVMLSDLNRGTCDPNKVRCIVVDEAHKALGNHAYAQVVSKIFQTNHFFRVLALSATPGNDIIAVQQVLKNLLISKVELRAENSLDVLPYVHQKEVEKITVPLDGFILESYKLLIQIFQHYTGKLMKINVLYGKDGSSFTKYQILKARESFRKNLAIRYSNHQKGYIEIDFTTCISLSHAIELITIHGLRSVFLFLKGVTSNQRSNPATSAELRKNPQICKFLADIESYIKISDQNSTFDVSSTALFSTLGDSMLRASTLSDCDEINYLKSHPKMKVLKTVIQDHFRLSNIADKSTRVMVFSQYRDSVQEIGNFLSTMRPLLKPMVFFGQASTTGKGFKQKDQVEVVKKFREGGFNVLISTSVGEEGLDIGEVDLIICYDFSKSPTRLMQRMGRTGRGRYGKIVFLLTEGKEERSYSSSLSMQSSISKSITDPQKLTPYLYSETPRMIPADVHQECLKMSIILASEKSSGDLDADSPHKGKRKVKLKFKPEEALGRCKPPEDPIQIQKEEVTLKASEMQDDFGNDYNNMPAPIRRPMSHADQKLFAQLYETTEPANRGVNPCLILKKNNMSDMKNVGENNILTKEESNQLLDRLDGLLTLSNKQKGCSCGNASTVELDILTDKLSNLKIGLKPPGTHNEKQDPDLSFIFRQSDDISDALIDNSDKENIMTKEYSSTNRKMEIEKITKHEEKYSDQENQEDDDDRAISPDIFEMFDEPFTQEKPLEYELHTSPAASNLSPKLEQMSEKKWKSPNFRIISHSPVKVGQPTEKRKLCQLQATSHSPVVPKQITEKKRKTLDTEEEDSDIVFFKSVYRKEQKECKNQIKEFKYATPTIDNQPRAKWSLSRRRRADGWIDMNKTNKIDHSMSSLNNKNDSQLMRPNVESHLSYQRNRSLTSTDVCKASNNMSSTNSDSSRDVSGYSAACVKPCSSSSFIPLCTSSPAANTSKFKFKSNTSSHRNIKKTSSIQWSAKRASTIGDSSEEESSSFKPTSKKQKVMSVRFNLMPKKDEETDSSCGEDNDFNSDVDATTRLDHPVKKDGRSYIDFEAEVENESASDELEDESNDLSKYDSSFIDEEQEEISESQQVRYMKSVKDVHKPDGYKLSQRSFQNRSEMSDVDDSYIENSEYENDSFCVKDDKVDYVEVGVFTQAMHEAKNELVSQDDSKKFSRLTRMRSREFIEKRAAEQQFSLDVLTVGEKLRQAENNEEYENDSPDIFGSNLNRKRRRRIVLLDSDDSTDDD